ncbi:MAG: YegS/Rv2252/BmrU family lipid kinase [Butyribacter sp.]|nr:YegS/Rv2252/BmrU family lipid kinase [bacterium]MDY3855308.1 YegS/Rv2252/BmrU family lipid kinase [Butyribacter sp.]
MLFIYNPMAGKEQIKNKLSDIVQILCKGGFEITIFATQKAGDATDIVKEKGMDYEYIVCSGGDGTMNEVATGLMQLEKHPICGYIPAGTVNDFASSLKIPKIMKKAAALITEGSVFKCDLGQFNERYFTYVCGFGAFTEVSYQTPQEWKNALGKVAYFIEALKHIAEIKTHHMRIEYDGNVVEDNFILGLISNSVSVAGYKAYSKMNIMMDDGLFEALFIKEIRNPLELQATLNSLMSKKFDSERIFQFSASQIKIISDDDLQWTLDGEDGGSCSEVTMTNHQYALPIICDKRVSRDVSQKYLEKKQAGEDGNGKEV